MTWCRVTRLLIKQKDHSKHCGKLLFGKIAVNLKKKKTRELDRQFIKTMQIIVTGTGSFKISRRASTLKIKIPV